MERPYKSQKLVLWYFYTFSINSGSELVAVTF
jgi:hypothetical protein